MKAPAAIVLFAGLVGGLFLAPAPAAAQNGARQVVPQDELRSVAPNVYLDCDRRACDFEYIKTEITFVNYVLDRQSADIQIIVTRQQTRSGGNEYTDHVQCPRRTGSADSRFWVSSPSNEHLLR